jgi:hypothetical protein
MKKAEFVKAYVGKGDKYKSLVYKYRGYEYTIYDYGFAGLVPYGNTLAEQHRNEQTRIDDIIWHEEHPNNNGSDAMEDFAFFWAYVNDEIDEDGNKKEVIKWKL